MSTNYTPATYADGSVRTGTEQTNQETRIDTAVGALEGVGYAPGEDIHTNSSDILAIKGASGPPAVTLVAINTLVTSAATVDPGHKHTSASWNGSLPAHNHVAGDLPTEPGLVFAGQTDFDAAVGPGWTSVIGIGGVNLMAHDTSISTNVADILAIKGVGWATETIKDNNTLIISGNEPGHTHTAATSLTDYSTLALQTDLDELTGVDQGQAWNVGDPQQRIWWVWNEMVNGAGPGHTHPWADITGVPTFPSQSDFDALAGVGWNPTLGSSGRNAIDLYNNQVAMQGVGWTTENIKQNADDIVSLRGVGYVAETVKQNATDIAGNTTEINKTKGAGYTNTIGSLTNVTGVTPSYPSANGSPVASYTLQFVFVSYGNHTLSWGGGAPVVLSTDLTTYQLFDSSGTTFINGYVEFAKLPSGSTSDVGVQVTEQNISDLYDKFGSTIGGSTALHVQQVHGDSLVQSGSVTANGSDRQLTISGIQIDIGGALIPASTGGVSGTLTPSAPAATNARVDAIVMDATSTLSLITGSSFRIADGIVTFPSIPATKVLVRYVWVPGDRSYLIQSDVMTAKMVKDFKERWAEIGDGSDYNGAGIDQVYGKSIEFPRLIPGIVLGIERVFHISVPEDDNINFPVGGIIPRQRNVATESVTFYNTSPPGQYSMVFTLAGTLLSWDGGVGVNVGSDGTYTLMDSTGTYGIEVDVVAASLPASDQTALIDIGTLPVPDEGRYDISYSGGQITFDGGTPVTINGAAGVYAVASSTGKYVNVFVEDTSALPTGTPSDKVRVYPNSLTDLDMKLQALGRIVFSGGSGVGATGTTSTSFTIGNATTTGTFQLRWGTAPLTDHVQFDHRSEPLSSDSTGLTIPIADTSGFVVGREIHIFQSTDLLGERAIIASIVPSTNLTLAVSLLQTYTTANNATVEQIETSLTTSFKIPDSGNFLVERNSADTYGASIEEDVLGYGARTFHGQMFGVVPGTGIGTLTDGALTGGTWELYKEWLSNDASLQLQTIMLPIAIPSECLNFASMNKPGQDMAVQLRMSTSSIVNTDNYVTFNLYKQGSGVPLAAQVSQVSAVSNQITTLTFPQSLFSTNLLKGGDVVIIEAVLAAKSGNDAKVYGATLQFMRRPEQLA